MTSEYTLLTVYPGMTMQHVQRMSDGAFIPFDGGNRDYQLYLQWVAAGNEADPAQGPPTPLPAKAP